MIGLIPFLRHRNYLLYLFYTHISAVAPHGFNIPDKNSSELH